MGTAEAERKRLPSRLAGGWSVRSADRVGK